MNIIRLYNDDDVESPTRDRTVSGDDTRAGPLFYNNRIIPREDRDRNTDRYQYRYIIITVVIIESRIMLVVCDRVSYCMYCSIYFDINLGQEIQILKRLRCT